MIGAAASRGRTAVQGNRQPRGPGSSGRPQARRVDRTRNQCPYVHFNSPAVFRVKICGVTRPEDAAHAVAAGADAIGLNFYPRSPRCVAPDRAAEVANAAEGAAVVGVFVNAAADEIGRAVEATPLGFVQLHGDEPVELLADLPVDVPVVRAARVGRDGLRPIARQLDAARDAGRPFAAVLLDAAGAAGEYGGTGRTADWARIAQQRPLLGDTPLLLAGGLTPENVADAVRAVRPDGVDTASGVESAPGRKDQLLVGDFVARARGALAC